MRYPGGKGGDGVYQTIINQIPPHHRYFEPFAGGAAIYFRKRPAVHSFLCELDPAQAETLASADLHPSTAVMNGCGIMQLSRTALGVDDFVYCDPPYVRSTRTRDIYQCEMTDLEHAILLDVLLGLRCRVMISGYASSLYADRLADWRRLDFQAMTRGGVRTETLWMNYPEPTALHDYSYYGDDRTQRQCFKRKVARWVARLEGLPPIERSAVLEAFRCSQSTAVPESGAGKRSYTGSAPCRVAEAAE